MLGRRLAGTPNLWFRRQFNLAPTDSRYLDATPLDILTEMYAHFYDNLHQKGKLADFVENETFEEDWDAFESGDADWVDVIHE